MQSEQKIINQLNYTAMTTLKEIRILRLMEKIESRIIDLTIIMDNAIYIIEFKVDIKQNALQQIKEKKYYEKYINHNKNIYLILFLYFLIY